MSQDLHARRWACPAGSARPWLAVGPGLYVSGDRGHRFTDVATPPGAAVRDAAATSHHVWLATSAGLYVSWDGALAPDVSPVEERPHRARRAVSAPWLTWLPKVSVQAGAHISTGQREVEAMAFAQLPFAPHPLPITLASAEDATARPAAGVVSLSRVLPVQDPERDCLGEARRKAVELAMAEPERARSYVARAGRAAWLPELRVLVSRRYGRSESLDVATSSTALSSPLGIDTVNDIRYEARATWDLAKLVFSTEELAAQNQALHMAELRRDIENTVNRLYFERRRLAVEATPADLGARQLRMHEIEAELDAFSGGSFAACIESKR